MAFLAATSGGDLEKALSDKFNHVTFYNIMINDLPTHSVIPSKKRTTVQHTQYSAATCFFLETRAKQAQACNTALCLRISDIFT